MKSAMQYTHHIDTVLDQMRLLTDICYRPSVLIADGKIVDFEMAWSSKEAEQSFELLQKRLKYFVEEQQKITLGNNEKIEGRTWTDDETKEIAEILKPYFFNEDGSLKEY